MLSALEIFLGYALYKFTFYLLLLTYLYFQKLESLAYIFVRDSMGLSSFKFVQWAPKDVSILQQSALWPFEVFPKCVNGP